jgi:hypothetical protein
MLRKLGTVMVIAIVLALTFGSVYAAGPNPLDGTRYDGWVKQGNQFVDNGNSDYDYIWEGGVLWAKWLNNVSRDERREHLVSFTILPGEYSFNGVECELHGDWTRNERGLDNPVTIGANNVPVSRRNDVHFTVTSPDGGNAYAVVWCAGNASTGFSIETINVTSNGPAATTQAPAVSTPIPGGTVPTWNNRQPDDQLVAPLGNNGGCGIAGQWQLSNGQTDDFMNPNNHRVHAQCVNGTEYFWFYESGDATPAAVPTNPAVTGDNPYGLTVASCTENNRDGWVVDPSKLATASTCRDMSTFTANDCPATQNNAAINAAESNRLQICTYFAPEGGDGGGLGNGGGTGNILTDGWNWLNQAVVTLLSVICGSPFLLLLLVGFVIWLLFFRNKSEKTEGGEKKGRFSNWRIVKWWNNRTAKPEAHDAHDATGKITMNDEKDMVVEVDGNDAGFEFEPSFSVKDDAEYRTKWEKLPAGLTFDRDSGIVTISDATLLKRGTFTATLTVMTIGEDHPSKATSTYKIKVTPKSRTTQPVDEPHDDTPADPHAGLVPVLIGGHTEWVKPQVAQFLASLSNPAPTTLDDTVRQDTVVHRPATTVRHTNNGELTIVTNPDLPKATQTVKYQVGDKFGFGIRVEGSPDHRQVKRTIKSGNIPQGMTFSESGWLSGVPAEAGDFDFVVLATDSATGKTAEQTFHLHVDEAQS